MFEIRSQFASSPVRRGSPPVRQRSHAVQFASSPVRLYRRTANGEQRRPDVAGTKPIDIGELATGEPS